MGANIFDLIIIGLLAFSAFQGYNKGLIATAASIIALILGVWGAIKFSDLMANILSDLIKVDQNYLNIIAFAATFVLIVIGVHFVAKAAEKVAEASALTVVNKVIGSAFGVLKTAFIISIIIAVVNAANNRFDFLDLDFKNDSLFYEPLSDFAPKLFKYLEFDNLPDQVKEHTKAIDI